VKRQWTWCTKCVFCGYHKTIDHLFISSSFARPVWRVVHFTYNIPPSTSVNNLFENWLNGIGKQTKAQIRVGICALVWAILNCRNGVVFNKNTKPIFLQVIHRSASSIHMWSYLLPPEQWVNKAAVCITLMQRLGLCLHFDFLLKCNACDRNISMC
jgi:hypothetical protein